MTIRREVWNCPAHAHPARRTGAVLALSALVTLAIACGGKEKASPGALKAGATKEQAPPAPPTPEPILSNFFPGKSAIGDILVTSINQDFARPQINRNSSTQPLSIGGKKYETGIGTHANSRAAISFPAGFRTLSGACGLDDDVDKGGSVIFRILAGDRVLFRSQLIKGRMTAAVPFSVNISGHTELTLVVDDAGDGINADHADWVDLRLNK